MCLEKSVMWALWVIGQRLVMARSPSLTRTAQKFQSRNVLKLTSNDLTFSDFDWLLMTSQWLIQHWAAATGKIWISIFDLMIKILTPILQMN